MKCKNCGKLIYGNICIHCKTKQEESAVASNDGVSLPDDEEIEQVASDEMQSDWNALEYAKIYREGFIDGAKWMRDEARQAG
jgi:hypothetical protein